MCFPTTCAIGSVIDNMLYCPNIGNELSPTII